MNRFTILFAVLVLMLGAILMRTISLVKMQSEPDQVVAFLTNEQQTSPSAQAPWETYLDEQGIPHNWIAQDDLSLYSVPQLRAHFLAIVIPDGVARMFSEDATDLLQGYVRSGGIVVVVGDAGTQLTNGRFVNRAQLAELTGVEYLRFRLLGTKSYGHGIIRFADAQAVQAWDVPYGKLEDGYRVSSYGYGALTYALPATQALPGTRVDATSPLGPAITERRLGAGKVFYVAPLLGYLRSIGDSFLMNIVMRHVLFHVATVPHLVAAPDGRGQIIFNWHIDSNEEWLGIPNFAAQGLFRPDIRYDFDVTAGPYLLHPSDGSGFDACGKGKPYLQTIERYGSIGSHGGWAHNWFAFAVQAGKLNEAQMRHYIAINGACLREVTHEPILDYAAPNGAHPWQMTLALASLGIRAYYYTGDTGTSPELAFFNGKLVTNKVWAFPIMPNGSMASLSEMSAAGLPPSSVQHWLVSTVSQAEEDRSIYLMYSHVYDLLLHPQYTAPFASFVDRVERDQHRGLVRMTTMVAASAFMDRFTKTHAAFVKIPGGVAVTLSNPAGLRDIAFALPRSWINAGRTPSGIQPAGDDATFAYYTVTSNVTHYTVKFPSARRPS